MKRSARPQPALGTALLRGSDVVCRRVGIDPPDSGFACHRGYNRRSRPPLRPPLTPGLSPLQPDKPPLDGFPPRAQKA